MKPPNMVAYTVANGSNDIIISLSLFTFNAHKTTDVSRRVAFTARAIARFHLDVVSAKAKGHVVNSRCDVLFSHSTIRMSTACCNLFCIVMLFVSHAYVRGGWGYRVCVCDCERVLARHTNQCQIDNTWVSHTVRCVAIRVTLLHVCACCVAVVRSCTAP